MHAKADKAGGCYGEALPMSSHPGVRIGKQKPCDFMAANTNAESNNAGGNKASRVGGESATDFRPENGSEPQTVGGVSTQSGVGGYTQ